VLSDDLREAWGFAVSDSKRAEGIDAWRFCGVEVRPVTILAVDAHLKALEAEHEAARRLFDLEEIGASGERPLSERFSAIDAWFDADAEWRKVVREV